jgi:hypothetical protein
MKKWPAGEAAGHLIWGLAPEAVAIAGAIKMADAVMMHTDADANRADANADAFRRGANRRQGKHAGDERRFENGFHFLSFHLKPSRGGTPPCGIRCWLRCGEFHRPESAAISAESGHGGKSMVNQCLKHHGPGGIC